MIYSYFHFGEGGRSGEVPVSEFEADDWTEVPRELKPGQVQH